MTFQEDHQYLFLEHLSLFISDFSAIVHNPLILVCSLCKVAWYHSCINTGVMERFFSPLAFGIVKFRNLKSKENNLKGMFYRKHYITVYMFFWNFPFQVKTDAPDLPDENQAREGYRAIAYSSLSQSYLYIDWTDNHKALLVGEYLNIIVTPKSPYIDKITHYNYLVSK